MDSPTSAQLEVVAGAVDPPQAGVGRLAVERRVDVGPAREDDTVKAIEQPLHLAGKGDGQSHGQGPGLLDRAQVALPEPDEARLPLVVAQGDPEEGPAHIRSGTGMPSRSRRACIWRTNASTMSVRKARRSSPSAWRTEYWGFW